MTVDDHKVPGLGIVIDKIWVIFWMWALFFSFCRLAGHFLVMDTRVGAADISFSYVLLTSLYLFSLNIACLRVLFVNLFMVSVIVGVIGSRHI